jgi:L-amino acid N-acyltransferase YncA
VEKKVRLKDRTEILIRDMMPEDLDLSLAFFRSLPDEDRAYLRRDVAQRGAVEGRIREIRTRDVMRLVAVADDQVVADGSLERSSEDWKKHVGEVRLIVAQPYKRKGLGRLMARELFLLAAQAKMEEILVRMMRPQKAAQSIFHRLGFRQEMVLPDYVVDRHGKKQDMIIMRCDLEALWREMEDFFATGDWERTR